MKLLDRFKQKNRTVSVTKYQMITDERNGFFAWNGNLYKSDIVRAAIRPKVRAIGKTKAKHVRKDERGIKINPQPYMRFLLEEPNTNMTMQQLLERVITQLELNNNAFLFINRDEFGYPFELYPITATSVELLMDKAMNVYYRFTLKNGKIATFNKQDVMHLGKDYNDNELFGDSNAETLAPLMEIVNTTDQGIVKAIKNSNIIRWLLKFNQTLRPEDIKEQTKNFVNSFLNTETSESVGAAATDSKMEATQVDPKDYVPNEKQMDKTIQRVYSFFNTNEDIIQSKYTEDKWISYYESSIEPDIVQLSTLFTRHLFTRKERAFGNEIVFESSNLSFASMNTKLQLVQFVDRGIMSPNEVREILNYAPAPDGDTFIRRLDTAPTTGGGENK